MNLKCSGIESRGMCGPEMNLRPQWRILSNYELHDSIFHQKFCRMIKERKLRVDGPVARKAEMTSSYKVLV
jgi:hypothetical protein